MNYCINSFQKCILLAARSADASILLFVYQFSPNLHFSSILQLHCALVTTTLDIYLVRRSEIAALVYLCPDVDVLSVIHVLVC